MPQTAKPAFPPCNLLEDGRLCYINFGLTGTLIQRELEVISDLLTSIIGRNEQKAARVVVKLDGSRDFVIARSIEREVAEFIERFQNAQGAELSFTALLGELVEILVQKGLRLPQDLFLLVKSLLTIEGVATAWMVKASGRRGKAFSRRARPLCSPLCSDR